MSNLSRRAVLQFATAATATILVSELSGQSPATAATLPQVEVSPGAIEKYLTRMQFPRNLTLTDVLTLSEIKREYQNAVIIFPLVLPEGWQFPVDPGLFGGPVDGLWQRGSGANAAYVTWHRAVTGAAYAEHQQGRPENAKTHLDLLEAGYATEVRKAAVDDPGNVFLGVSNDTAKAVGGPLRSARAGDYAEINSFLGAR